MDDISKDPKWNLTEQFISNGLGQFYVFWNPHIKLNIQQHLLQVRHGVELILTSFMKNLVRKSFTTGGAIDICLTLINCRMIRDRCACTLKCDKNAVFTTVYEDQMLTVLRYSHRISKQYELMESIRQNHKNFADNVRLVRPIKKSIIGIHDIEGVGPLNHLRVHFRDLHEHKL